MKKLIVTILGILMLFAFSSCTEREAPETGNEETTLTEETTAESGGVIIEEDTTLGTGSTAVELKIVTEEKTLSVTLLTDKTKLGDALRESGLVEGEDGPYGLYIKKVNGVSAVYETDGAYWSLEIDGEPAVTGADSIEITENTVYSLVRETDM